MRISVTGGAPQSLTSISYLDGGRLAVDDQYAYWTDYGDLGATSGHVYRVPRDGSGPVVTLVAGIDSPYGVAVDDSNLFVGLGFHADATNGVLNGGILRLDKLGTPPVTPTVLASNQAEPLGIAIDDTSVYWGDHISGYLMKVPQTGGAAVPILSGEGSLRSSPWTTSTSIGSTAASATATSPAPPRTRDWGASVAAAARRR